MFKFGIPNKRNKKEEKYPHLCVITMVEQPDSNGAYKFVLNKKAIDLLNYHLTGEEQVSFAFDNNDIYISNTTNTEHTGYRVAKQGTFSNVKLYGYIKDLLSLDTTKSNEFILKPCEHKGFFHLELKNNGLTEEVFLEQHNESSHHAKEADISEIEMQAKIEVEEFNELNSKW